MYDYPSLHGQSSIEATRTAYDLSLGPSNFNSDLHCNTWVYLVSGQRPLEFVASDFEIYPILKPSDIPRTFLQVLSMSPLRADPHNYSS